MVTVITMQRAFWLHFLGISQEDLVTSEDLTYEGKEFFNAKTDELLHFLEDLLGF